MRFLALLLLVSCASSLTATRNPLENIDAKKAVVFERIEVEEINSDTAEAFITKLKTFEDGRPFVVVFDSPGGSVRWGEKMSAAIERSPVPVICVVDGMAASMGFYILQSCDVRVMTTRSLLMGHEPASATQGQPSEMSRMADLLQKLSRAMAYHITRKSRMTVADYLEKVSGGKEFWLTVEDASFYGFIDYSVGSVDTLLPY